VLWLVPYIESEVLLSSVFKFNNNNFKFLEVMRDLQLILIYSTMPTKLHQYRASNWNYKHLRLPLLMCNLIICLV
jgi:hypothetical protein